MNCTFMLTPAGTRAAFTLVKPDPSPIKKLEETCPDAVMLTVVRVLVPSNVRLELPAKLPDDRYCIWLSDPPGDANVKPFCM